MGTSSRQQKIMEGAATWCTYYRNNVDEFAKDYLHLNLRIFQRILLVMMFYVTIFVFIAARGLGKTFLSAVYSVIRCILYPGTHICIASATRGQAIGVLEKIRDELIPKSPELKSEIQEIKINNSEAYIKFFDTSMIKVVTASDTARGNRCNVLLLDESRLINKATIDTILRKFLTLRRLPDYIELTDEEKKKEYDKEKNLTLYLTSAYFKDSWMFDKCIDTFKNMVSGRLKQFVCGLPYQLSLSEGLLDPDTVADEMAESDFSEVKWGMEMEALFYGAGEDAFFDFDSISKNRKIKYPILPDKLASKLNNANQIKIAPKANGEIRILSADIALMSSKKHNNDATAIFMNSMTPTKASKYINNIVYSSSQEGLRTDDQALVIRKLFDEFSCDYLVIDCQGIGMGCADLLMKEMVDPDSGEIYPALSCCNNPEMAARCTTPGAEKVIWAIKANAQFNSDCAFLLREGFRSGQIRLLDNEFDAEESLQEIRGYNSLSPSEKIKYQLPYINTTLLIDELVNLQHEESGGKIKIYEKSGMRKDRYSSLAYNYYVAKQIEQKLNKRKAMNDHVEDMFIIRPPSNSRKAVRAKSGKEKSGSWW